MMEYRAFIGSTVSVHDFYGCFVFLEANAPQELVKSVLANVDDSIDYDDLDDHYYDNIIGTTCKQVLRKRS
jgi:hypothetical protein